MTNRQLIAEIVTSVNHPVHIEYLSSVTGWSRHKVTDTLNGMVKGDHRTRDNNPNKWWFIQYKGAYVWSDITAEPEWPV